VRWNVVIMVIAAGVVVTACAGSPIVARVNGETITAAQVDALTAETPEGPAIPGAPFRDGLGLLIVNAAIRTAAEEQFGATGLNDPDLLAARIADPPNDLEVSRYEAIASNPGFTDAYSLWVAEQYTIRDAVLTEIAVGGEADAELDGLFSAWGTEAIDAADVWVRSQVGEWGGLAAGVMPPGEQPPLP
jgi:hypothetical protein